MNQSRPDRRRDEVNRVVRITTGARLHFGLLDVASPFGGIGVMIEQPATRIDVRSAATFKCAPPSSRIESIARTIADRVGIESAPPIRVEMRSAAPEHCGLGSGTQRSMAAAEAICVALGEDVDPLRRAATIARRGQRSAVGIHGYLGGGMVFEEAKANVVINPVRCRIELPATWRVVVVRPRDSDPTSISGDLEQSRFRALPPPSNEQRFRLRQLITDHVLPAAHEADFDRFAAAVGRYNRLSGELFAKVQGGPYNGPAIDELVSRLIDRGIAGVGQSSWGPAVFSWFASLAEAQRFASAIGDEAEVLAVSRVLNRGRTLTTVPPETDAETDTETP